MPRELVERPVSAGVPTIAEIGADEFTRVRTLLHQVAGIRLGDGKAGLVRSRLARRLRALQLTNIGAYLDLVESEPSGEELSRLVDALTTNKTEFFREQVHFSLLERTVLPDLAARRGEVRIWCAGCSTGEEPYSTAIVARETLGADARRVRILATDISSRVLATARHAEYPASAVHRLPADLVARHFTAVEGGAPPSYRVAPATQALVTVARLNLMDPWPMRGAFDVVFCRNTMIYFDRETQERLIHRFAEVMAPGGYLFVGHSESLAGRQHVFTYVQPATYRR